MVEVGAPPSELWLFAAVQSGQIQLGGASDWRCDEADYVIPGGNGVSRRHSAEITCKYTEIIQPEARMIDADESIGGRLKRKTALTVVLACCVINGNLAPGRHDVDSII